VSIRSTLESNQGKQSGFFYGYIILIASFLILFIVGGTIISFGVFLKPVLNEFGWSRAIFSGANSINLILGGVFGILAGRIGDRFGPRLALTIGGLFMGLGFLLMSQVQTVWQIYFFYGVLLSLGTGFVPIPVLSLLARWFIKGRGLATGIAMSGVGVGIVIVPPLADLCISTYSWQTCYMVFGFTSLILIIALAQLLKQAPGQSNQTDNSKTGEMKHLNLQVQGYSLRGAMGTLTFWMIIVIGFLFFYSAQSIMVHIAAHATDIGFSSVAAAAILSVIGFVNIAGTVGGGILADKISSRNTLTIIFALATLSYIGFRFSGELWMLYLCAAFFGLSYGGFTAIQSPLMADFFGLKNLGVIFSFFMLAQNIGGGAGSLLAGSIYDKTGNYAWAFNLCALLSAVGLILSLLLSAHRKRRDLKKDLASQA
jgi:MFS transporter, OFA family, oxalate/formate antiporter